MKNFVFQGDSITDAGRDRNNWPADLGKGYPDIVAARVGAAKPGEYLFMNEGVSGDRVVDMYARIRQDCINNKPDILTILIGVNDVWHEFNGRRNGVDNDKYFRVYSWFIEEVKQMCPDCRILILEPFVLEGRGPGADYDTFRREVEKRAVSAKAVADKYGLEFLPLQKKLDDKCNDVTPASYWLSDGVHPTAAGHGFIADEIIKALDL